MIRKKLNSFMRSIAMFGFATTMLSTSIFAVLAPRIASAAPEPVTFNIASGAITCNIVLEMTSNDDWARNHDNYFILDTFYPGFPGGTRSEVLETEANTDGSPIARTADALSNNSNIIAAYFVGVSAANDYDCLDQGLMFQDSTDPNRFYGVYKRNAGQSSEDWSLRTGEYDATTKSFRLNNGVRGAIGQWYEIKNSTDAIASHSSFTSTGAPSTGGGGGGGTVSTGPCAGLPSGPVYNACYNLQFADFATVTFRDETYVLNEWGGGDKVRYYMTESYDSARNTENTKADCQPYFEFSTGGGGGQLDFDLDDGGDDQIDDFVANMNGLGSTFSGGEYVDYDLNCTNVDDPYFAGTDGTPVYNSMTNMRRMLIYSPSEQKIGFMGSINPASEEELIANLTFNRVGETNTFESAKIYDSCGGEDGKAVVVVDGDLASVSATSWRGATLKIPKENCSSYHDDMIIQVRGLNSTETIATASAGGQAETEAGDTGNSENDPPEPTCASEGGALGWILCPILILLDEGTQAMESQIQGFLFVDTERFTTDSGAYQAWSTFRGLATVIIVIIALIMIFSQAMGDGVFDNYSVKKLLPRLLLAGITIQLSWFLITQLVNVFNILGNGIGGLLLSSFDLNSDTNLRDQIGQITAESSGGDFVAGAAFTGLVIAAPALMGGIVAVAIGVAAAILTGLITLIVRDMIILLGVVLAPVAIAMSVLPGTQKTSKWWWESLEKALAMYPIVMALLASGKVVATLLFDSATPAGDAGVKVTYLIAGIIAWYAPFFFLPKALQAGGSALGKISGLTGDKTKGLLDKARSANDDRKKRNKEYNTASAFAGQRAWWGRGRALGKLSDAQNRVRRGTSLAGSGGLALGNKGRMARDTTRASQEETAAKQTAYRDYREKLAGMSDTERAKYIEAKGRSSLILDNAEIKTAQIKANADKFDLSAAKAEMELKEAELNTNQAAAAMGLYKGVMSDGKAFSIGDKAHVLEYLNSAEAGPAGDAQRTAALKQLSTLGADAEVRKIRDGVNEDAKRVLGENVSSQWFQGAFKDKAGDLTKGGLGNAFKAGEMPDAPGYTSMSPDTMRELFMRNPDSAVKTQYLNDIIKKASSDPDFAASLNGKQLTAIQEAITAAGGSYNINDVLAQKQTK